MNQMKNFFHFTLQWSSLKIKGSQGRSFTTNGIAISRFFLRKNLKYNLTNMVNALMVIH
jgi:hypothetical protein